MKRDRDESSDIPTPPCVKKLAQALADDQDEKSSSSSSSSRSSSTSNGSDEDMSTPAPAPLAAGSGGDTGHNFTSRGEEVDPDASLLSTADGPTTFSDLFQFYKYNGQVLLQNDEYRNNLQNLLVKGVVVHDAYSGLGTAPVVGKLQFDSLRQQLEQMGEGHRYSIVVVVDVFLFKSIGQIFFLWTSGRTNWQHVSVP